MKYWTIIGTFSSIIAAIAAIIAVYFAFISRPRNVNDIAVGIESVQSLEGINEWKIELSVGNVDEKTVLQDAMVAINTDGINLLRIIPKSAGGMLMMPNMVLDEKSVNFSIDKIKPRTKKVGAIKIKAEPGLYNLTWYGYGANLKQKNGSLKLFLTNSEKGCCKT